MKRRRRDRTAARQNRPSAEGGEIDRLYGLEPLIEPGDDGSLGEFAHIDCPWCGERFVTHVDATAGASRYVEDCQVCCRPIDVSVRFDETGALESLVASRLD